MVSAGSPCSCLASFCAYSPAALTTILARTVETCPVSRSLMSNTFVLPVQKRQNHDCSYCQFAWLPAPSLVSTRPMNCEWKKHQHLHNSHRRSAEEYQQSKSCMMLACKSNRRIQSAASKAFEGNVPQISSYITSSSCMIT